MMTFFFLTNALTLSSPFPVKPKKQQPLIKAAHLALSFTKNAVIWIRVIKEASPPTHT